MRFYYNFLIKKFEPIGLDGHDGTITKPKISAEFGVNGNGEWLTSLYGSWFRKIFGSPDAMTPTVSLNAIEFKHTSTPFLVEVGATVWINGNRSLEKPQI